MSNAGETHHQAHTLRARMSAGVDWFIPDHVRSGDLDALRRARLVVVFASVCIAMAIMFAAIHNSMNSPISAAALMLGVAATLWVLLFMRRTGSSFMAGNLFTAVLFGVLTTVACRTGGNGCLALPWYAAVPVVALTVAGRRSAVVWLACTVLSLAAFYALDYTGYSLPNDLAPHHEMLIGLLGGIGLIALMLALTFLFELAKDQMATRLAQHGRFLSTVVEALAHPFLVMDANDCSILLANAAARRDGAPEAKTCHALTHRRDTPCEGPDDPCPLVEVKRTGKPTMVEHTHCGADGSPRLFEVHAHPVFDEDGRIVQVIEYSLDITERKQADATLREAKEQAEGHARRATEALNDMERMNAVMMVREERVLEMKQEVNDLLAQLGRERKYEHV